MQRLAHNPDREPDVDVSATTFGDLAFNLMLIFLAMLLLRKAGDETARCGVELPQASAGGEAPRLEACRVSLDAEGSASVDGEVVGAVDEHAAQLAAKVAAKVGDGSAPVVVAVDERSPARHLLRVVQALSGVTQRIEFEYRRVGTAHQRNGKRNVR